MPKPEKNYYGFFKKVSQKILKRQNAVVYFEGLLSITSNDIDVCKVLLNRISCLKPFIHDISVIQEYLISYNINPHCKKKKV